MNKRKAILCVLASGALWGCVSLFVRQLDAVGLSTLDMVAIRMIIGAVGMLVVILVVNRNLLRIRLRDIWLFAGTGIVSITLFNLCYFTCITTSEASIAVVLLYTSPIFVMVMSAIFFKERITRRKVVALAVAFIGCAFVAGVFGGVTNLPPLALAAGIASGFFYATYSIFGRKALERYDTLTVTFYTFVAGSLASLVLADIPAIATQACEQPTLIGWYAGLGVLCTLVPYLLYTAGLKYLEPSKAAIFATIEPLVGSALGILAYGESVGVQKIAGMVLILLAVVLASSEDKEQP